jgi:hypothetical protein
VPPRTDGIEVLVGGRAADRRMSGRKRRFRRRQPLAGGQWGVSAHTATSLSRGGADRRDAQPCGRLATPPTEVGGARRCCLGGRMWPD